MMPRLLVASLFLLAACGADLEPGQRPGEDAARAVVEATFVAGMPAAVLDRARPRIRWHETACPYPAQDGAVRTAVIEGDTCYAGLSRGCALDVAWRGTFSRSAFAHELMHCYLSEMGRSDPAHDRHPEAWALVGQADAALADSGL